MVLVFLSSSDTGVDVILGLVSELGELAATVFLRIGVFATGLAVEKDWERFKLDSSESLLLSAVFLESLFSAFFELLDLRRLEKLN